MKIRRTRSGMLALSFVFFFLSTALFAQRDALSLGAGTVKIAAVPETARPGDPVALALAGPGPVLGAAAFAARRPAEAGNGETAVPSAQPAVEAASGGERPGAALFAADGKSLGKAVFFNLNKESLYGPVRAAILAVPTTARPGEALIRAGLCEEKTLAELAFTIENRAFKTETLVLSPTMSDILSVPDPQKTREAEQLWRILNHTGNEVFSSGNFVLPVDSQVQTSLFGGRRVYRYPDGHSGASIHAGVDYRAREGTPITVCAPGRVVFAGPRIVSGNTVIIEHMPGVYSLCYHLSKISLTEGQTVVSGDPLGEAGSTGFSTAAHLHWEIRAAGENTDPEVFMNRNVLDKDALLGKLYE